MNFFSDERAAELRELFFDTAQELLQSLNDAGLELEKRPADSELLRRVQRTVHTLKGDSAACGYLELTKLAHELEDVLTPELARAENGVLAEVVLTAADTFHAMLAALRGNLQPPSGEELRAHIAQLVKLPAIKPEPARPRFAWSEYDRRMIADAIGRHEKVYNVALHLDPHCALLGPALQLIRNVLQTAGTVLALNPEENTSPQNVTLVEAALASEHEQDWIAAKCQIPAVVSRVDLEKAKLEVPGQKDVLTVLLEAEAAAVSASGRAASSGAPAAEGAGNASIPTAGATSALAAASESTLRVEASRIDAVLNLVGELIIGKSMLHQTFIEFEKRYAKDPFRGKLADALAFQSRVLDDLQKSVMKIRMVPVEQLFRRFPRVVRDLAKLSGKEVTLVVSGQHTDLDKSVLDALAEPLLHLVRNAVDHGIEPPDERIAAGKRPAGTVRLNAYYRGNQAVIEVSDDGLGIDHEKVVARAVEKGMVSAEEASKLSRAEALELLFRPGFSTAVHVTQVSGRGVGLDAVRSALAPLKGMIHIEGQPGQGTKFVLSVPLSLTSVKALLFHVNDRPYAVPIGSVVEIARATESQIHQVGDHEVYQLRDQLLTLVRLNQLGPTAHPAKNRALFIIVTALNDRKFGLIVDRLMGEEELVIKALDNRLLATDLVSGASILGDGTVVLILTLPAVIAKLLRAPALGATA